MTAAIVKRNRVGKIITPNEAHDLIKGNGGRWFWVAFTRKNAKKGKDAYGRTIVVEPAGAIRYMQCRTGVTKYRKTPNGEGRLYNYTAKRLTSVEDRKIKKYRSFSWDHLVAMRIGGVDYIVLSDNTVDFCNREPQHEISQYVAQNRSTVEEVRSTIRNGITITV